MLKSLFTFLFVCVFCFSAFAEVRSSWDPFHFNLYNQPERPRDVFWPALGSLLLPGLDQWWEGQYGAGVLYSGVGGFGLSVYQQNKESLESGSANPNDFDEVSDGSRRAIWGAQLYQTMGSLSAYHSFRTAVKSHRKTDVGAFYFLGQHEETTKDLLIAPFHLELLARPTTFIPLGLLALGAFTAMGDGERRALSGGEALFVGGVSYNAGVGEEALFRGWMYPMLTESWDSPTWANIFQSTLFAVGHINEDNPVPWPQFALGYYFAWLTKRNGWTLQEAIFIHTWWDVIVFTASFLDGDKNATLHIPLVVSTF